MISRQAWLSSTCGWRGSGRNTSTSTFSLPVTVIDLEKKWYNLDLEHFYLKHLTINFCFKDSLLWFPQWVSWYHPPPTLLVVVFLPWIFWSQFKYMRWSYAKSLALVERSNLRLEFPHLKKPNSPIIPQVLVNLFTSALSTTPSDGLTALTTWILTCIFFVFVALLFYVVILLRIRANSKVGSSETQKYNSTQKKSKTPIDLDISFLLVHLVSFAFFVIIYSFVHTS